jgi:exonuclease VII large subunit
MNLLQRGYVAVTDQGGNFKKSAFEFKKKDLLTVVFMDGKVDCSVVDIRGENHGSK